jgi:hypothetical protein
VANGDRSIPKKQFEVFCEGEVGRIEDFPVLAPGSRRQSQSRHGETRDKRARLNVR